MVDLWMEIKADLQPAHFLPPMLSLCIAYVLALPLGWNREKEARSAGLRTFPLVAIAACGFIQAAERIIAEDPQALARIIQGVITGIGFVGGGAILQIKDRVQGTATAASLWATGAIGVAVGVAAFDVALIISLMTFLTLGLLTKFKKVPQTD